MPQIKHPADPSLRASDQVKASSVLFGLVIITALIVASAAWMGGSLSSIGKRMSGAMDGMARTVIVAATADAPASPSPRQSPIMRASGRPCVDLNALPSEPA